MKLDYEKQVRDAEKRIAELEARHAKLEEQRSHLDIGRLVEAKHLRKEMDEIEDERSDLKLLRDIAQEQLDKWQKGMAKAKPLVEDGGAAHERGRDIFVEFAEYQEACRVLVKELDEKVNVTMSTNAKEFQDLTGENMGLPLSMVCYQAAAFAGAETIRPYDRWTFRSESALKNEHKAELDKKLQQHEIRLKLAESLAPNCEVCARSNRETKMVVDKRSGHLDTPGESLWHGQWHLVCPKCGTTLTVPIPEAKK